MFFEIKRSIQSKMIIHIFIVSLLMALLAIALVAGLDELEVTKELYFGSFFSVVTQFGILILSFIVTRVFLVDINSHSTYFYQVYSKRKSLILFNKYVVIIANFVISFAIIFLIIGLIYGDIQMAFITFVYSIFVIIYQITLISIISIFIGNMMYSIALSIGAWIFTVVLISVSKIFLILNPFDQGQHISTEILQNITNSEFILNENIIMYLILYVFVFIIISLTMSKKWIARGI